MKRKIKTGIIFIGLFILTLFFIPYILFVDLSVSAIEQNNNSINITGEKIPGSEEKKNDPGLFNLNNVSLGVDKVIYGLGKTVHIKLATAPEIIKNFSIVGPEKVSYTILPSYNGEYEFMPDSTGKYVINVSLDNGSQETFLTAGFEVVDFTLVTEFGEPEQERIVLGKSVNWSQHIFVANPMNFAVSDFPIDILLQNDYSNLFSDTGFTIDNASVLIDLAPGESMNFTISYQTSRVMIDMSDEEINILDLIPSGAFDMALYREIEDGEPKLTLNSNLSLKRLLVWHNSTIVYHNIPISIPVDEDERVFEIVDGSINEISASIYDGVASWIIPTLHNKTFFIISMEQTQGKAKINEPVEWQLDIPDTIIKYKTTAPYAKETGQIIEKGFWKKEVIVGSNASVHYSNVSVYTDLPEDKNLIPDKKEQVDVKLFLVEQGSRIDVTDDLLYNVSGLDANGDSIIDQVRWNMPLLLQKTFEVEYAVAKVTSPITAKKSHFRMDENPEFIFEYADDAEIKAGKASPAARIAAIYKQLKTPEASGIIETGKIKSSVYTADGKISDIEPELKELSEGKVSIKIPKKRAFRAGVYTLQVEYVKDGISYTREQEFQWGLVSLNTRKSIYKPGDIAEFIIVVLDRYGHPVNDADIFLTVSDPSNVTEEYSTGAGTITLSDESGVYNANYPTKMLGNHKIDITASVDGTEVFFNTFFQVKRESEFDIVRTATPNSQSACRGGVCEITCFVGRTFYEENGSWNKIETNFEAEGTAYDWKSEKNSFKVYVKGNEIRLAGEGGSEFTFNVPYSNPTVSDNIMTYDISQSFNRQGKEYYVNGIMTLTNTPNGIEKMITIYNLSLPDDFEYVETFNSKGNKFIIGDLIIWDSNGRHYPAEWAKNGGRIRFSIIKAWLDSAIYPIYIDPTVFYVPNATTAKIYDGAIDEGTTFVTQASTVGTEIDSSQYPYRNTFNDGLYSEVAGTIKYDAYDRVDWTPSIGTSTINWVFLTATVRGTVGVDNQNMGLWNFSSGQWVLVNSTSASSTFRNITFNITGSNVTHFVSSTGEVNMVIRFGTWTGGGTASDSLYADYYEAKYDYDLALTFSSLTANKSVADPNEFVNFTASISTNDDDLSGYIFSSNFSGAWTNSSWVSLTGTQTNALIWNASTAPSEGTHGWRFYANTSTNLWNASEISLFAFDFKPNISFTGQTDTNGATVTRNWSYVNVSVNDTSSPNNLTSFIDWNRSLVGWWRFNYESGENDTIARDWSTYSNDGTNMNMNLGMDNCTGTCSGWTTNGKFGNALNFDGVDDYVNAGNDTSLKIPTNMSLFSWVKFNNITKTQYIIGQAGTFNISQYALRISSGKINVIWSNKSYSSNATIQKDAWYHIGFTRSGTTGNWLAKIYINGTLDNTTNSIFDPGNGSIDVNIGRGTGSSSYNLNGSIDEVQVWNRVLSPEEINASYNTGLYRLYHNFTNLSEGNYTYTAYAQDLAGNVNQTETRTLTYSAPEFTPPTLTLDHPSTNGTYYNYVPYFNGTCTDASSISTIWTNISQYGTATSSPFNLTNTTALPSQRYDVNISCNDTQGNIASKIFFFTYDAVIPSINFTGQTDNNGVTVTRNWSYVNVSVNDTLSPNNLTSFIDWNRSLVGWWRFNYESGENDTFARDWSTYANNGTPTNMNTGIDNGTSGWTTSGKFGKGIQFDGINDNVNISDANSLDISNNLTISLWFSPNKLYNASADYIQGLIDKGSYRIFLDKSDGKLKAELGNGSTSWNLSYDGSQEYIISLAVYNGNLYAGQGSETGDGDVLVYNGTSWTISYDGTQESIYALAVYNGKLYAGQGWNVGDGDVLVYDGTSWTISYDGTKGYIFTLAIYNGKLYAGQGSTTGDGDVLVYNGTSWTISYDGAQEYIRSFAVYNGKLYAGQGYGTDDGDVLVYNGTSWTTSYDGAQEGIYAFAVYNGNLYAGQGINSFDGDVLVYDGTSWTTSYDGSQEYISSLAVYNGKLYAGQGSGTGDGDVLVYNGISWTASYDGSQEYIYALAVYNGKLYAGQGSGAGDGDVLVINAGNQISSSTSSWQANTYHQAVISKSETSARLYIDGIEQSVIAVSSTVETNGLNLFLGKIFGTRETGAGEGLFNGTLDDILIYNRALSPEEINASYNAGVYGLYHNFTNLSQGNYTYTAYAQDLAGNVNQTETRTLTIAQDSTPPQYSLNQTNSTGAGQNVLFSMYWTDNNALAGYIFSFDNGTGTFSNNSYAAMTGTGNWSNATKTVNSTVGSTIRWRVYANDTAGNMNASVVFSFVTTLANTIPDFRITNIAFTYTGYASDVSETGTGDHVRENANVTVNATIHNYGGDYTENPVYAGFYDGESGQVGKRFSNVTIRNATGGTHILQNTDSYAVGYWNPSLVGTHNISVWADWTNVTWENSAANETNNNNSKLINVSAWQKYWGNVSGNIALASSSGDKMYQWAWSNATDTGYIYIVNSGISVNWTSLHGLGSDRDNDLNTSGNDFYEADTALNFKTGSNNATGFFNNNITQLLCGGGLNNATNTTYFIIRGTNITNVPIVNSTNMTDHRNVENANFITGLFWEQDSGNGVDYYDGSQNLIFVGKARPHTSGLSGITQVHNYEVAIPSALNATIGGNIDFYVELK